LAGCVAALPLENVETIAPMARLVRPPGLPSPWEGILNLAGKAVPVLRLGRLLALPVGSPGLHSMLIVLKSTADGRIAWLVDRVSEILSVPHTELLPLEEEHSFNACAEATVPIESHVIYVLSPARILLEKERDSISEFQAMAQQRINDGECGKSENDVAFP
jgi:purine-binding chemotaxis protein CheW